jgi:hypothetical protein
MLLTDGFELEKSALGALLGSGSYKEAYEIAGHPDYVMTVAYNKFNESSYDGDIDSERAALAKLNALGIPAARVIAAGVITEGDRAHAAHLMPRYVASDRSIMRSKLLEVANENTVASALKIMNRMRDLDIALWDTQFLIDAQGFAFISDPGDFRSRQSYGKDTDAYCKDLINVARFVLGEDSNKMKSSGLRGCDIVSAASTWVKRHGSSQTRLLERFPDLQKIC